jgi:hypothetical protein
MLHRGYRGIEERAPNGTGHGRRVLQFRGAGNVSQMYATAVHLLPRTALTSCAPRA